MPKSMCLFFKEENMNITYKENGHYSIDQMMALYLDVKWSAYTDKPELLSQIIEKSLYNVGAFYEDELIGLIRVVGDGISIIYIQDILVKEKYQRMGIGRALLQGVLKKYEHVRQIVLMTENTEKTIRYYTENGLKDCRDYNGVAFIKYNL